MFSEITARINGTARGNVAPNMADMALLRWLAQDYGDQAERYERLRAWYSGAHDVPLTDRQQEYLGVDSFFEFAVNYLRLPVELCVERMTVTGFDGPDGIGGRDGLLAGWWEANRMDGKQKQVTRAAAVDGDTYLLVEWDTDRNMPIFSYEPAYDGDEGVKVHYLSNHRRVMTFASKRWKETTMTDKGDANIVRRLNIYTTDAIYKYIESGAGWKPFEEDGQAWPLAWEPGIIPVVHFRWKDDGGNWGESELEPLIPLQMMVNKAVLDEAEARDKTAFQLLALSGTMWPQDLTIKAGDVLSVSPADARWTVIPPANLTSLQDAIDDYVIRMAQIAHIPLQYFQMTGAVASADTQAADDSQLVAKVASESVSMGNAWEDVMRIAMRLYAVFGTGGRDIDQDEPLRTIWADFERVDPIAVQSRKAAVVQQFVQSGASLDGALKVTGYSDEDIDALVNGMELAVAIAR